MTNRISVVIITKNESARIRKALASVRAVADEIVVVDDLSSDDTCRIAEKEFGAKVFRRASQGDLSAQRNFGADQAAHPWILIMDSDEIFSGEICQAIRGAVESAGETTAFLMGRLNHLMGHPICHAGAHQTYILRVYRKDSVRYREPGVHHEWDIRGGTARIEMDIPHYPFDSASVMIERALFYGEKESAIFLASRSSVTAREIRQQLIWKALKSFWKMYVKKQGYKDGLHGLVWCLCMVIGSQIRWIKIWEKAQSQGKLVK